MSLSFVSSTVQKGTEDGGYEETPIETSQQEREFVNRRNANKPLFEQLRDNQEEEKTKQEELQRQMMRGTRALDEDDVAHLDALEKQKLDRERAIQEQTRSELAMFRAAKAMRQQQNVLDDNDDEEEHKEDDTKVILGERNSKTISANSTTSGDVATVTAEAPAIPRIKVIKKRKRKQKQDVENEVNKKASSGKNEWDGKQEESAGGKGNGLSSTVKEEAAKTITADVHVDKPKAPTKVSKSATQGSEGAGLSSLLSGYGSSSEEED
jgi:FAM192A/Fyv6, N-terminal domain